MICIIPLFWTLDPAYAQRGSISFWELGDVGTWDLVLERGFVISGRFVPNRSAICCCVSQTVSSSTLTSSEMELSGG